MPRPQNRKPFYAEIMTRILDATTGPIPVKEFSEQILALRTTQAKNPLQAAQAQIQQENGRLLVYLDKNTILPVRLAMQGVRFRLQLSK